MEARDRSISQWFERVRSRQVVLPRFQRMEAWGPSEVSDLLRSVLHDLPAGAALVLEVGDRPLFVSRPMVGAPETGERINELLLDGQQRLTALWRSLTDDYPDRTYYVKIPEGEFAFANADVVAQGRWERNEQRYPRWADSSSQCWQRHLVPIQLLRPGEEGQRASWEWIQNASTDDDERLEMTHLMNDLRQRVAGFNLPFLALPVGTSREVALDVFVKLNTRMVRLSAFDVIVAQFEEETASSLHDLVSSLNGNVPRLQIYDSPEDLALQAACLLQNYPPNHTGYFALNLAEMHAQWPQIVEGARFTTEFLEAEGVFDAERLPTVAVLAPLIALHAFMPRQPDMLGNTRTLLRKYLWRSFFTDRYEQAAATAALQDFRALRGALLGEGSEDDVPCLRSERHPLPDVQALATASWPRKRDRLARAVLLLSLRGGALDIADGGRITQASIGAREYHHLFPVAYLREQAGVAEDTANRALNCILITWLSNRTIGGLAPYEYLLARAEANDQGEVEIRRRLATHAVDYNDVVTGDYGAFIDRRAGLATIALEQLCNGYEWRPFPVFPPFPPPIDAGTTSSSVEQPPTG